MKSDSLAIKAFRREVWKHYRVSGRHDLPWRKTTNAYKILVSEVMLQQTQVPRVLEKYKEFLKAFPTVTAFAKASLSAVLKVWSGLGYNRRGKYLHDAAKVVVGEYRGNIKKALEHPLPGVGPYTRAAVRAFAYNEPHTMIETNIRAVYLHHFADLLCKSDLHKKEIKISDAQLVPLIEKSAEGEDPRTWHWALMDYGSYLKKQFPNPSRKSAGHKKQSKFEGSLRQVRGAVLRALQSAPKTSNELVSELRSRSLSNALAGLERDGMIRQSVTRSHGLVWRIAE